MKRRRLMDEDLSLCCVLLSLRSVSHECVPVLVTEKHARGAGLHLCTSTSRGPVHLASKHILRHIHFLFIANVTRWFFSSDRGVFLSRTLHGYHKFYVRYDVCWCHIFSRLFITMLALLLECQDLPSRGGPRGIGPAPSHVKGEQFANSNLPPKNQTPTLTGSLVPPLHMHRRCGSNTRVRGGSTSTQI